MLYFPDHGIQATKMVSNQSNSERNFQSAITVGSQIRRYCRTDDFVGCPIIPEDWNTGSFALGTGTMWREITKSDPIHRAFQQNVILVCSFDNDDKCLDLFTDAKLFVSGFTGLVRKFSSKKIAKIVKSMWLNSLKSWNICEKLTTIIHIWLCYQHLTQHQFEGNIELAQNINRMKLINNFLSE